VTHSRVIVRVALPMAPANRPPRQSFEGLVGAGQEKRYRRPARERKNTQSDPMLVWVGIRGAVPREFWITLSLTLGVVTALHLEWRRHRRVLASIPIRIHVNGTRGKSSVTRLIASVLREDGIATVAKTTGTAARIILPDGTEVGIPRDGPPNIGELTRTARRAAGVGARAIVFECMAVHPERQRVAEDRIVQPTITVVTNARLDHTDVQGNSPEAIASGFAVRPGGNLVTADPVVAAILGPTVTASGGSVHLASAEVQPPGMAYLEHPENIGIALEVAKLLRIPRAVALAGIRKASPDPGAALIIEMNHREKPWTLVNLFAANDPESAFRAMDLARPVLTGAKPPVVLFASRGDRGARSAEFAAALAERSEQFSRVVVFGQKTSAMTRMMRGRGLAAERVVDAGSIDPEALTRLLDQTINDHRVVVGLGNIIGPAQNWLDDLACGEGSGR
jgi:poly-gamma-glutamate synthase PgsB/CapB